MKQKMFYVWLFSSSFFIISLLAQISLFSLGMIPNLMNTFMTLALEITTTSLMIKKLKEPHKQSYSLKAVGLWFLYYGLFLLVSGNRTQLTTHIAIRIEFALILMSIGILIFYYNQIGTEINKKQTLNSYKELPDKSNKSKDKYFDLLCQIHYLLCLDDVQDNPEFCQNLIDIMEIIRTVEKDRSLVSYYKLDDIIKTFEEYGELIQEPILTLDILKRLSEIEDYTKEIKATLKIYYRKVLSPEIEALNSQINSIDNQLRQNGLVEPDFIITNNKRETE